MNMMKTIAKIYLILAAASSVLTSCNGWLDISPKSELKVEDLFSNEQGYRDALIGVYSLMSDYNLYGAQLTCTWMGVMEQYYPTSSAALNRYRYAYAYDYSNSAEEARINSIWKSQYNAIANVNSILNHIDENSDVCSEDTYKLIKGESLGLRALLHFDLLRLFGPSPASAGFMDAQTIPYVDYMTKQLYSRLTSREVLDRIIKDLEDSRTLLESIDPYGPQHSKYDMDALSGIWKGREYRMNYYAATALLARVLMWRNDAASGKRAATLAREVINSGLFPLITSEEMTGMDKNGFVSENIFSLEVKGIKEDISDKYFYVPNTSSMMLAVNSNILQKVFPTAFSSDYRRLWWVEENGSYYAVSKYNYSERMPMIKVSEMYLIVAEVEQSPEYYNTLTYHRGLPETDFDADNCKDIIRREYAKEFFAEGQSFYACKRMGYDRIPIVETPLENPSIIYTLPLPKENNYFDN